MNRLRLYILDWYIIKRYFLTYLFVTGIFMIIVCVFDVTEKIDSFISYHVSLYSILFDYFANFIPYFAVSFTPLFLFIAVIYFTSRMAAKSEFIAMINSGMKFRRLVLPYMLAAFTVTAFNLYANHWLIPNANKTRIAFELMYIDIPYQVGADNFIMPTGKNEYVYLSNYTFSDSTGFKFGMDKFDDHGNLLMKFRSEKLVWNAKKKAWMAVNYMQRINQPMSEQIQTGKDTLLNINFSPRDFLKRNVRTETLNAREMNEVISDLTQKGDDHVVNFLIEKYKRTAFPFAIPILTLIAVSLASRKVRGGMGLHIMIGFVISFSYILFMQFANTFSTNSTLPPLIAAWIPNTIFLVVALLLYRSAPK